MLDLSRNAPIVRRFLPAAEFVAGFRIKIAEIDRTGLRWDRVVSAEAVSAMLTHSGVKLAEGQSHEARLVVALDRTADDSVSVRGSLRGAFAVPCSRCLAPAPVIVDEPALNACYLPPGKLAVEEEEHELTAEELDAYLHDGETLDLEDFIREHLVLAIPIAPLCDESCRGICSRCGAQLNHEPCGCGEDAAVDTPWVAALKALKNSN